MNSNKLSIRSVLAVIVLAAAAAAARAEEDVDPAAVEEVEEEILVVGEKQQPYVRMDSITMSRLRSDSGKGARLYRQKRYEEAFPYLLSAAQAGFKLAQARVGYLYHKGLGGVERDGVAALGWLGVAASGRTSPEIRSYFRAVMKQVPETHLGTAEQIVADYQAQYGTATTGIKCDMERQAGTHISRLKCDHRDEYRYDDVDLQSIAEGITNSAGGATAAPGLPPVGAPP